MSNCRQHPQHARRKPSDRDRRGAELAHRRGGKRGRRCSRLHFAFRRAIPSGKTRSQPRQHWRGRADCRPWRDSLRYNGDYFSDSSPVLPMASLWKTS